MEEDKIDFFNEGNSDKINSFENNINTFIELNRRISTIKKGRTTRMTSIETIIKSLNDNKIPYPNNDEIPLIKIKDENHFENGDYIENYKLTKFDDNKFNICRQCKKDKNKFFCRDCDQNICVICYNNCKNKNHTLIDLEKCSEEVNENIKNINIYISKYFLLPKEKEKENSDGIEKKNKSYNIMEELEFEANNEIEGKFTDYTNDIILINSIIEKKYINYFHYMNIKGCLYYLKKKYDYIIINYNISKNGKAIRLFGKNFVKNNKNICQIVYEDEYYELNEFLKIDNIEKNKILEIKLIGINNIIDASYMFSGCESLISLPDITQWKTNNVINMSNMFHLCEALISLPDISKWNTNNVTDMNSMFEGCKKLNLLPDISNWKTNNVTNMSYMFNRCESLISLPNISKWNTNNVIKMEYMLNECYSLKSFPDISNWNTNNVIDMNSIFEGCKSLTSLPDISKWNTNNVTNMSSIFCGCESLTSLPDISKWNTNNLTNMSSMFCGCKSLISMPDIAKWNTNNVIEMNYIFRGCKSLNSLPDISKWNIKNIKEVKYKSYMFSECESLKFIGGKSLSDFEKHWDLKINNSL